VKWTPTQEYRWAEVAPRDGVPAVPFVPGYLNGDGVLRFFKLQQRWISPLADREEWRDVPVVLEGAP
jgi:hypothetical protein